jgi:hypothetical protein
LSSILRALKKLEEETVSGEEETGKQKTTIKQVVKRRTWPSRVINRFFSILAVILLVGTAAVIIVTSIREPSIIEKQKISPDKNSLNPLPPESRPLKKEIKEEIAEESPEPSIIDKQSKQSTIPASTGSESNPPPMKVDDSNRKMSEREIALTRGDQQEIAKKDKYPDFSLNGVLWSDKRERRVALINDRYLKEGEEIVRGVVVFKIDKKAVTLKAGEEQWTIKVKKN